MSPKTVFNLVNHNDVSNNEQINQLVNDSDNHNYSNNDSPDNLSNQQLNNDLPDNLSNPQLNNDLPDNLSNQQLNNDLLNSSSNQQPNNDLPNNSLNQQLNNDSIKQLNDSLLNESNNDDLFFELINDDSFSDVRADPFDVYEYHDGLLIELNKKLNDQQSNSNINKINDLKEDSNINKSNGQLDNQQKDQLNNQKSDSNIDKSNDQLNNQQSDSNIDKSNDQLNNQQSDSNINKSNDQLDDQQNLNKQNDQTTKKCPNKESNEEMLILKSTIANEINYFLNYITFLYLNPELRSNLSYDIGYINQQELEKEIDHSFSFLISGLNEATTIELNKLKDDKYLRIPTSLRDKIVNNLILNRETFFLRYTFNDSNLRQLTFENLLLKNKLWQFSIYNNQSNYLLDKLFKWKQTNLCEFNQNSQDILETKFKQQIYLSDNDVNDLCLKINSTSDKIKKWFTDRRSFYRINYDKNFANTRIDCQILLGVLFKDEELRKTSFCPVTNHTNNELVYTEVKNRLINLIRHSLIENDDLGILGDSQKSIDDGISILKFFYNVFVECIDDCNSIGKEIKKIKISELSELRKHFPKKIFSNIKNPRVYHSQKMGPLIYYNNLIGYRYLGKKNNQHLNDLFKKDENFENNSTENCFQDNLTAKQDNKAFNLQKFNDYMENLFKRTIYPNLEERENAAKQMNATESQVRNWFINKRSKIRIEKMDKVKLNNSSDLKKEENSRFIINNELTKQNKINFETLDQLKKDLNLIINQIGFIQSASIRQLRNLDLSVGKLKYLNSLIDKLDFELENLKHLDPCLILDKLDDLNLDIDKLSLLINEKKLFIKDKINLTLNSRHGIMYGTGKNYVNDLEKIISTFEELDSLNIKLKESNAYLLKYLNLKIGQLNNSIKNESKISTKNESTNSIINESTNSIESLNQITNQANNPNDNEKVSIILNLGRLSEFIKFENNEFRTELVYSTDLIFNIGVILISENDEKYLKFVADYDNLEHDVSNKVNAIADFSIISQLDETEQINKSQRFLFTYYNFGKYESPKFISLSELMDKSNNLVNNDCVKFKCSLKAKLVKKSLK